MASFLLFIAISGEALAANAAVLNIRLGGDREQTRFVVDLDRKIGFSHLVLADPYRIVIDLPEVDWKIGEKGVGSGRGIVGQYRYGLFKPGVSRLVLDLRGPAIVEKIFLLEPKGRRKYRLVIDLKSSSRASFLKTVKRRATKTKPVVQPARLPATPKTRTFNEKRIIMIDPGHGGVDPGAMSVLGVPEKKIALNVALEIRRTLQASGKYAVLMTRDRDIFVPLARRVEFAHRAGADLFISVHADSIRNPKVRGATVYTLSEKASDKEAAALASKENKADLIAGLDLGGETDQVASILIDLAQRETMNYSARFANLLVPELKRRLYMRNNSHRFAGFRVLKAPDVPSTLLEMGYLSNRDDARQLNSKQGRAKIASAIAAAVDSYFTTVVAEGF